MEKSWKIDTPIFFHQLFFEKQPIPNTCYFIAIEFDNLLKYPKTNPSPVPFLSFSVIRLFACTVKTGDII